MDDLREKMKERWSQRRKKSMNWSKLLLMFGALIAILFLMKQFQNGAFVRPRASQPDSLKTELPK
ncbi:MAG: hypothetical protein PHI68_03120 [Candidatus Cloacimonetes bacterium]|nr:hypothetical protein [Candidatus Cloacimonadota bacterium]